jgi:hypothetical protein
MPLKQFFRRTVSFISIVAAFSFAATSHAAAAPAQPAVDQQPSISLAPAVIMVKARPGQTFSQDLTLYNNTTMPLAFDVEARDVAVRDGQRIFLPAGELDGSIARNAVFTFPSVSVLPGNSATTTVMVTLPATPGPRAISVVFVGKTILGTRNGVAMTGSLGALITFTLSDDFRVAHQPIHVDVDPDSSTISFHQAVKNIGDEPVVPTGVIAVTDDKGKLVARVPLPVQRLLPGENGELAADYTSPLKPGNYRVTFLMENESAFSSNAADFTVK